KSTQMVKSGTYSTPYLSYINDYGGRPVLQFSCAGSRCTAVKK
ncbi:molecular chaperone, partial [Escherichia coli]|nr:molecular chaperone [Escherichia coli]MCN5900797.1 molecular chaperone [Escherichia coli]